MHLLFVLLFLGIFLSYHQNIYKDLEVFQHLYLYVFQYIEDNIHHQLRLESALYDVAKNLHLHIYVECATTLEEFEDYKQKEAVNQVYFLDLEIDGDRDKGFQIAKTIRETNPYAVIIFTTTLSEAMPLVSKNHVSATFFADVLSVSVAT